MTPIENLTKIIKNTTHLLIYAGAGMSVELGSQPYWTGTHNKYGGNKTKHNLTPIEHATEQTWHTHPNQQHQYAQETRELYLKNNTNSTHNLYTQLLKTLNQHNIDYFVATSNVDNAFHHYGYNPNRIYEKHGNYFYDQCLTGRNHTLHPHNPKITKCETCGSPLRPNILMFYDTGFSTIRETQQYYKYDDYIHQLKNKTPPKTTILEIGVGTTILAIRNLATKAYYQLKTTPYIHLNPNPDPTSTYTQLATLTGHPHPTAPEIWVKEPATNLTKNLP